MLSTHELTSYLNDHLTASTGEVELFKRVARSHASSRRGEALAELADVSAADRQALVTMMERLGVKPGLAAQALGWAGEKAGRLKPNGSLLHRTQVTDLVEIEGLRTMVAAKIARWQVLRAMGTHDDRLGREELETLLERADAQAQTLYEMHLQLAQRLFADGVADS